MKIQMADHCEGLTMEDGTKYKSKPGGTVEVTDPGHIAAIQASPNYNLGHMGNGATSVAFADCFPDNLCPQCHFSRFPWQKVCPRCRTESEVHE